MQADRFLPLTPVVFEIALALAAGERHGYEIMQEVERRSDGQIVLHPGTLYRALGRLLDQGLIEELDERPGGRRRRRAAALLPVDRARPCRGAGRGGTARRPGLGGAPPVPRRPRVTARRRLRRPASRVSRRVPRAVRRRHDAGLRRSRIAPRERSAPRRMPAFSSAPPPTSSSTPRSSASRRRTRHP